MKRLLLTTALSVLIFIPAQAQFFKKLKQKVEQRVEESVTNKIADKAALEAEKSMDNLMDLQLKNSGLAMGMESVDPADIPASYTFDYEYKMKMTTPEGDMDMVYLLKEDAPYIGIKIPQAEDLITVLDNEEQMTVMYMSSDEHNFVMANRINTTETDTTANQNAYENMEITELGTKNILGYECQGYQMEDENNIFTFYMTREAGVSFQNLYQTNQKDLPAGLEAEWLQNGDALMMEMQMEDKNNAGQTVTMVCTGIDKKLFSIETGNYQSMAGK